MTGKAASRTPRPVREQAERLAAARDELDARQVERRKREDEGFARYAAADLDAEKVTKERDAALADLDRQRERVHAAAEAKLADIEDRQRDVLAELNRGARSAEDLATLFGLPLKRVRTLLRAAKAATPGQRDTAPQSGGQPPAATAQPGSNAEPDSLTPAGGAEPVAS